MGMDNIRKVLEKEDPIAALALIRENMFLGI
jgi:hypothetical protein